ncbi:MAG: hypothetical protein AAFX52_04075 [Pseudomonadota bacterium]
MNNSSVSDVFRESAKLPQANKRKRLPPLSFRATEEERALLNAKAGARPLSAYIREKLLGDAVSRRACNRRLPSMDHAALSKALALLGQSRLSSNMNQIAKAAHMGRLPVDDDVQQELWAACADIRQMRMALIEALDLKVRD